MSEKLKALLGEELYNKIEPHLTKIYEDHIPKTRFNEVNNQKKEYEKQIGNIEAKEIELQNLLKDNGELKTQYDTLNTKYIEEAKNSKIEIDNISKRFKIENLLKESGAINPDLLISKFDLNNNDFTSQLAGLKESYKSQFVESVNKSAKIPENKETQTPQNNDNVDWGEILDKF